MNWAPQQQQQQPTTQNVKSAGPSPYATNVSSPSHQYGGSSTSSPRSTPLHQTNSPSEPQQPSKPDYSRSHFDQSNGTQKPKAGGVGGDIFADILGQQGYNFASKSNIGPRSINEMRKEEISRDMDPEKLKILEWVSEFFVLFFCTYNVRLFLLYDPPFPLHRPKERKVTFKL